MCLEFLNRYTAALELAAKRVLRHRHRRCRSWCSLVNKVWVWCTTWQLLQLYLCFITELKWKVSAGERDFYPDSAFLVQNCKHLVFNCEDSRHTVCHNGQTEHRHEAKTLCKK